MFDLSNIPTRPSKEQLAIKLSDAKRYKETYTQRKDAYNAKRRVVAKMKMEMTLC
jgi:hypothetical protein